MKNPLFTGCATALVTPFRSGSIDYAALHRQLSRQLRGGVSAVVVCGTTGEAPTITKAERSELIRVYTESLPKSVRLIVGIGSNCTEDALLAAREAEALGADGVLLTAPYYNKTNRAGLLTHFLHVADGCGLPLIIYNVPGRTSIGCSAEDYARLAEHPRINGVKEASGSLSLVSQTRRLCGDALNVWSGNDDQTLPILSLGGKGVISVASNVIPTEMQMLCLACFEENFAAARMIHDLYSSLFDALFLETNPIPVKKALQLMGLDSGELRLPLCPLSDKAADLLRSCLAELRLIPVP